MLNSFNHEKIELVVYWFFISLLLIPFSKIFSFNTLSLLLPLIILISGTLDHFVLNKPVLLVIKKINIKVLWKTIILALTIYIILFNFSALMSLSYGDDWFMIKSCLENQHHKVLIENRIAVAEYVQKLTSSQDKIWTSDAAIAFLSNESSLLHAQISLDFKDFFKTYGDTDGVKMIIADRGPIRYYRTALSHYEIF